jgi:flavorubredoxin
MLTHLRPDRSHIVARDPVQDLFDTLMTAILHFLMVRSNGRATRGGIPAMKKVLIVYHSQSGNTEAMARAVSAGARSAGAEVSLKKAPDVNAEDMLDCDIVAIGTPNYFGYMAGLVKDCFDRVWAAIRDRVGDKPYVTFGSKGGGGAQALDSVERICNSLKMVRAFEGILVTRRPTEEDLADCRELGKRLAGLDKIEKEQRTEEPRL